MRTKKKMTDKKEKLGKCDRCNGDVPEYELRSMGELDYCECCYDDMFVSWNDVLKK